MTILAAASTMRVNFIPSEITLGGCPPLRGTKRRQGTAIAFFVRLQRSSDSTIRRARTPTKASYANTLTHNFITRKNHAIWSRWGANDCNKVGSKTSLRYPLLFCPRARVPRLPNGINKFISFHTLTNKNILCSVVIYFFTSKSRFCCRFTLRLVDKNHILL